MHVLKLNIFSNNILLKSSCIDQTIKCSTHFKNFMKLMFVLSNNDIGFTIFGNIMASFRRVCSIDTNG